MVPMECVALIHELDTVGEQMHAAVRMHAWSRSNGVKGRTAVEC